MAIQTRRQAQDHRAQQNMRNKMKAGARARKAKGERARARLRKQTWGY